MINPALEYLSRRPEIIRLEIPCSFMAHGMDHYDKKVIVVHPVESRPTAVHVKVWDVGKATPDGLLPPVEGQDFPVESLAKPWHFFPIGVNPLGYLAEFPAVRSNKPDRPIPQHLYDGICGGMFFSKSHREHRRDFLWAAFLEAHPALKKYARGHDEYVQSSLGMYSPQACRAWSAWRTHMLDFRNEVAPELYYWATSVASSSSSASDAGLAWAASHPG